MNIPKLVLTPLRSSKPLPSSYSESLMNSSLPHLGKPRHILSKNHTHSLAPSKISQNSNGVIYAYSANTHNGNIRPYNEDTVSIVYKLTKSRNFPPISLFAVYDGHGGPSCAEYLRDNLHQFLVKEPTFPLKPKEALRNACLACEQAFLSKAAVARDRSGSCGLIVLVVGTSCYVANIGDSRAVLSGEEGMKSYTLTKDHKPADSNEKNRILRAGGKVYQIPGVNKKLGPMRLLPGRLSVSRSFGDIAAKVPELGGNALALIAEPELKSFKILPSHDFIFIGSDGVFDKLSAREIIQIIWRTCRSSSTRDIHVMCGEAVQAVLQAALNARSLDNITGVLIFLTDIVKSVQGSNE